MTYICESRSACLMPNGVPWLRKLVRAKYETGSFCDAVMPTVSSDYRPDDSKKSGFDVVQKKFMDACDRAKTIDGYVVFIIDEINRGDPARIFGELLTYLERGYRGQEFYLPF